MAIIAVNTRLLIKDRLDGIGWFTYETLKRITANHPEHRFIFLFDRSFDKEFIFSDNIQPLIIPPPTRHPVLWKIWFDYSMPFYLKKHKPDLFLSTDGYLSLSLNIPSVDVIHDINFEHYPQDLPRMFSNYYRKYFPQFAYKAKRIATVSEFSKNDICEKYKVEPGKVDVVYDGVSDLFNPVDENTKSKTRGKYTSGSQYFVFVGMLHPRKNISNLLIAFDKFKKQKESAVKMLIVGQKKWWSEEMRQAYETMQFQKDVLFTGRLPMEELVKVVASALAMTYVSYFEGFGIPVIEAMRAGTAVITSDCTSMPEVSGDAALLVDPFSVEAIAQAMLNIANNESLRKDLVMKGMQQCKKFSWDKTADLLWNTIEKSNQ